MSKNIGGDGLEGKYVSAVQTGYGIRKALSTVAEALGFNKSQAAPPEAVNAKMIQRCGNSGCLDKNDICCKACDIEKCRYKCDFLDLEVCEHQYLK